MDKIVIWSGPACIYCEQAKGLLNSRNIPYEERKLGSGWTKEDLLKELPQARTIPQVIINNVNIGGLEELKRYLGYK